MEKGVTTTTKIAVTQVRTKNRVLQLKKKNNFHLENYKFHSYTADFSSKHMPCHSAQRLNV